MHLGPKDVLLNLSLDFADVLTSRQVEESISRMESRIKSTFPEITRVFIEAQGARTSKYAESGADDEFMKKLQLGKFVAAKSIKYYRFQTKISVLFNVTYDLNKK